MLSLLSAGSNAQGQLGNSTLDDSYIFQACSFAGAPPGTLPSNTIHVLDIANGSNHTLVLLEVMTSGDSKATEVWGCGDGRKGQLGPTYQKGYTNQKSTTIFQALDLAKALEKLDLADYAAVAIGATWETSYMVLAKPGKHAVIVSFGSNEFGDLGVGKDKGDITMEKGLGVHVVDFSNVVEGLTITSAQNSAIEKVRAGQRHVIVSLKVTCKEREPIQVLVGWGSCRHGQLGGAPATAGHITNSPTKKGTGIVSQPAYYYSCPTLIVLENTTSDPVIEYSLGIQHSAFLHASGRVSALGSNRKNQIQGLEGLHNIRDVKCTWNGTYTLTADNPPRILSTGSNSRGPLGRSDDAQTSEVVGIPLVEASVEIQSMVCGSEHSLLCLSTGGREDEVWGWGWNEHGNLGVGNTIDSSTPVKVWPSQQQSEATETHPVRSIWAGAGSSWILCGTAVVSETKDMA